VQNNASNKRNFSRRERDIAKKNHVYDITGTQKKGPQRDALETTKDQKQKPGKNRTRKKQIGKLPGERKLIYKGRGNRGYPPQPYSVMGSPRQEWKNIKKG